MVLADGRVLAFGGTSSATGASAGTNSLASAEIFDPTTNSWSPTGTMANARSGPRVLLLGTGNVLVYGGINNNINTTTNRC